MKNGRSRSCRPAAAVAATVKSQEADSAIASRPSSLYSGVVTKDTVTEAAGWKCATLKEYRDLLCPRLNKSLLSTFRELTGLRLHVLWYNPPECFWGGAQPVRCPEAVRRRKTCGNIPAVCGNCLEKKWQPAARAAGRARPFKAQCGTTNFWTDLKVGDARLLTVVLQTLPAAGPALARSPVARIPQSVPSQRSKLAPAAFFARAVPFKCAVEVLQLVLQNLEASVQINLLQRALKTAQLRLKNLKTEDAQLRMELHLPAQGIHEHVAPPCTASHSWHIVQQMLEYVHTHYQSPLQLGNVADALRMNTCYLSSLFSHTMGVTFHHYLDRLRLAKAKELLCDPTMRVCEVACAAGYGSTGQFWRAFKAKTGLAPCMWRENVGQSPVATR